MLGRCRPHERWARDVGDWAPSRSAVSGPVTETTVVTGTGSFSRVLERPHSALPPRSAPPEARSFCLAPPAPRPTPPRALRGSVGERPYQGLLLCSLELPARPHPAPLWGLRPGPRPPTSRRAAGRHGSSSGSGHRCGRSPLVVRRSRSVQGLCERAAELRFW